MYSEANGVHFPTDNLFRRRKTSTQTLPERPGNYSKETSSFSLQGEEVPPIAGIHLRRPSRQPHDPPQGVPAQSDTGFARFLKEHSSPKHQRVTAGGRIVPMDPLAPALPKMQLPLGQQGITSSTPCPDEPKSKLQEKSAFQVMDTESNTSNCSTFSSLPTGNLGSQFQFPGLFPNISPGAITPAMILQPNVSLASVNQHVVQPEHQPSDYFSLFPYGAACNLGTDQVTWPPNANQGLTYQNATIPFMSLPSQSNSSGTGSSSEFSTNSNLSGLATAFSTLPTGFDPFYQTLQLPGQATTPQTPVLNQPLSFSGVPQEIPPWKSLQEATKEHGSLTAQLTRLDRYMAVHTWDLDPRQKRLLVEQRMSLVRELDAVRTYKEELESIFGQLKSSTSNIPHAPSADVRASSVLRTSGNAANKGTSLPARMNNSAATHAASVQTTAKTANQQSKPDYQWQSKENDHILDASNRPGHMSTNKESLDKTKLPCRDQRKGSNPKPDNRGTQGKTIDQKDPVGIPTGTHKRTTPTRSTPPDIRVLYGKIEEATRCGAPIDGLFQELATLTTRLSRQSSVDSDRLSRLTSQRVSYGSPERQIRGETGAATDCPKSIGGRVQSARLASRKQWASEDQPRTSAKLTASYETEEDEDGESWSSYDSTTDSWATIREGE